MGEIGKRGTKMRLAFAGIAVSIILGCSISSAAAPDLKVLKAGVVQIRTYDTKSKALAEGTGFVVDKDGYGITNFHVIQGASSATATPANGGDALAITVCVVAPSKDFVLFKVDAPASIVPLSLATQPPDEGTEVWALGYPLGLGYSVNRGVVNGIRRVSELPPKLNSELSHIAQNLRIVQHDCTINSGNSGGPLVDGGGKVVGVNTWSLNSGHNVYFAVSSVDVSAMLARRSERIEFATLLDRYGKDEAEDEARPAKEKKRERVFVIDFAKLPTTPQKFTTTSSQLYGIAVALRDSIEKQCPTCNGKRQITKTRLEGKAPSRVVTYTATCGTCNGRGLLQAEPARVLQILENTSKLLAQTDPEATKTDIKMRAAARSIHQSISSLLEKRSPTGAGTDINPLPATGQPVAGLGKVIGVAVGEDREESLYVVESPRQLFLLAGPRISGRLATDELVVFGGRVSGKFDIPNLGSATVLDSGFTVGREPPTPENNAASPTQSPGRSAGFR